MHKRIAILDGFRFIAIMLVIGMHYFSQNYRLKDIYSFDYSELTILKYGYLGVQFFFMISGFVIFMTLEKCKSFKEFAVRRIIRLYPALVICSVLSWLMIEILDSSNQYPEYHRTAINFIPSLTFIDPIFLRDIFQIPVVDYVDNVHWSLLVEVKFYILFGGLYFADKRNVLRNWVITVFILLGVYYLFYFLKLVCPSTAAWAGYVDILAMRHHLVYFTLGILFYVFYSNGRLSKSILAGVFLLTLYQCVFTGAVPTIFLMAFIGLFSLFLYRPNVIRFLTYRPIAIIGLASYPLYLLHENIGLVTIFKLANKIDFPRELIALTVIAVMVIASILIDRQLDWPLQKHFKKRIIARLTRAAKARHSSTSEEGNNLIPDKT